MHALRLLQTAALAAFALGASAAQAADANKDLVADTPPIRPSDPVHPGDRWKTYEDIFKPFTKHLSAPERVVPGAEQRRRDRGHALGPPHVGGFSTGPTAFAVNIAGAVPFAEGYADGFQGYNLIVIVTARTLTDLKGRSWRTPRPRPATWRRWLFPKRADGTRTTIFSGKHDQSVMGVNSGDYDAAAVASDVFKRMVERGQVKEADFRVIYRSEKFPTSSFAYAHDLEPKFRDQMLKCFYDYRFPAEMSKAFDGADRFYPVTYQKDWAIVRQVAESGGESFNRAAYDRETAKSKK